MASLFQKLLNFIGACFEWLIEAFKMPLVWVINHLIEVIGATFDGLISALPGGLGVLLTFILLQPWSVYVPK